MGLLNYVVSGWHLAATLIAYLNRPFIDVYSTKQDNGASRCMDGREFGSSKGQQVAWYKEVKDELLSNEADARIAVKMIIEEIPSRVSKACS